MRLDKKYKSLIESGILLGSAVLLAIFISLSLANYLGNSSMPNVAVSTTSMMPIYRGYEDSSSLHPFRGDILLVRKVPVDTLEVGDVIVFNATRMGGPPDPVVHRIIARWQDESNNSFFKTKGDNYKSNLNPDPTQWIIEERDIIGMVVIRIPHVGWFLLALQTTLGKILILTLAVLVLFGEEIFDYLGIRKKEDEKKEISNGNNIQKSDKIILKENSKPRLSFLRKKESIYIVIGLSILLLFVTSNVLASFTHTPTIDCFAPTDSSRNQSLLSSSEQSMIHLTSRSTILTGNITTYFYPIVIELRSGGFFNNIDFFEIHVNVSYGFYRWDIVNNYIGTHTIGGGIISQITGIVEISITLASRGLFASEPISHNFLINLQD